MQQEKAASTIRTKVQISENVRDFLEQDLSQRRAQSFRYPNSENQHPVRPNLPAYQNGTLPAAGPSSHRPVVQQQYPGNHFDSDPQQQHVIRSYGDAIRRPLPPPPTLLQDVSFDNQSTSARRMEMSAIASQEDERVTAHVRGPPNEFYSHPANKYKSLPVTSSKKKRDEGGKKDRNFVVATYHWLKKAFLGRRRSSTPTNGNMDLPSRPQSQQQQRHTRSYSLPRNTHFSRKKSSRREPPAPSLLPPPAAVPTNQHPVRIPSSHSANFSSQQSDFTPSSTLRRGGSSNQLAERRGSISEEAVENGMNPLQLGFPNLGNTCYWNATLQVLGALEPIARAYLNRENKQYRVSDMTSVEEFTMVFTELLECMWKNKSGGGEHIKRLRAIFHKENIDFGKTHQEDAHEFLVCLVKMLSKDAFGNECFDMNVDPVGLDKGAFKRNLGGIITSSMYCPICNYRPEKRLTFTPYIMLSFPERDDATLSISYIRDTSVLPRVYRFSVHITGSTGMSGAMKLIAHETGIPDNQLLLFQITSAGFAQTVISQHDLIRYRESWEMDEMCVTKLEQGDLLNQYELVTVLFVHAEARDKLHMQRLTRPFKCVLPINASYNDLINAIKKNSGATFPQQNEGNHSLLFAMDILIMDDNEGEPRILNRTVKHPLLNADAHQCMTEQTRIFPKLPQFLRLVVRWKRAAQFLNPANDSLAYHPAYIEPKAPSVPFSLRQLFARYFAPEYIADWTCDNCKNKGAVNTNRYGVPPNVIAVSLKRFQRLSDGNILKIGYPLEVPLDFFNINAFVGEEYSHQDNAYDAVSIACHTGSLQSGHYYAYSKNPVTDVWRRYDDQAVCTPGTIDCNAYFVLFQNRADRLNRKKIYTTTHRENTLFGTLRSRRSRETLNRIPNGPMLARDEAPYRHDNILRASNGTLNRSDIMRNSRQTHL